MADTNDPPGPTPPPPPPLDEGSSNRWEDVLEGLVATGARVHELLDRTSKNDWIRHVLGYLFYVAGIALPVCAFRRITEAAWCMDVERIKAFGPWGLTIIFGLPMLAAVGGTVSIFWAAGRLQISTHVLEQVAVEKARTERKASVWFPKNVKVGPVEVERDENK